MVTKKLETELKQYIPEAQKESPPFDGILDSLGKYLDEIRDTIHDFQHYSNYQKIPSNNIREIAAQLGIQLPRNMNEKSMRMLIKDVVNLHRANGTEKSLRFMFKIVGLNIVIDYVWMLNMTPEEDDPTFLFGSETIEENGVYVSGSDPIGTVYDRIPIKGELYSASSKQTDDFVVKSPYIRISVTEEDYNLFTDDYVDPVTGTVYSYTDTERFRITEEILDYFMNTARPANVAILEISTPFSLSDSIQYTVSDGDTDLETVNVGARYDGTLSYGIPMDRYLFGEYFGGFEFGNTEMTEYDDGDVPSASFNRSYPAGTTGFQRYIPTRKNTTVTITVPADTTVRVYTHSQNRTQLAKGPIDYSTIVTTLSNVTDHEINLSNVWAFSINIVSASASSVDLQVDYPGV